jgi:ribonuclease D
MMKISYNEELNKIFASKDIVKIFHDGNEDCSLLLNTGKIKVIDNIFDTQIAQRVLHENKHTYIKKTSKNSNISLKDLLKKYFNVIKDNNCEIKNQMNDDNEFWKIRPLNFSMINYAVEDVLYLEKLYHMYKNSLSTDLFKGIFKESKNSIPYANLNLNIKKDERLNLHKIIENEDDKEKSTSNNLKNGKKKISGMIK